MFPLTRWQLCRLLIQVIFKRDYLAVARTLFAVLFPAHETVTTVDEPKEPQTKPPRFEYDPIASRMVKRSLAGLLVLASVSSAWALGSVDVMDPITKLGKRLTGGDGITISGSTISASGTATAFANYTSAEGGRVTVDVFANHTSSLGSAAYTASSDYATAAQGAKADTALQPGDVDNEIYAVDYNGGALNSTTINAAITAIGSTVKTLVLTPGDWAMSADITVPSNITLRVQPGAKIVRASGNLSINGPLDAPQRFWLSGFTGGTIYFGAKISDAYTDWHETTGAGLVDDSGGICAILRAGSNIDVYFNGTKKHLFASECQIRNDGVRVWGNNATIVSNMESVNSTLYFGGWKSNTTGVSVGVTSGGRTLTIPNGVSVNVGDMIIAYMSTPYSTDGGSYYRGVLTEVLGISGSIATISIPSKETFTADVFAVWYPAKGTEVHDLKFDNSASTSQTRALWVQAKDFSLSNVEFTGSLYAAAGVMLEGIRGRAENIRSHGYFGQAASCLSGGGGRPCGYGATVYGHDVSIMDSTLSDSKHTISMCKGTYTSENLRVENSTLSQDPTLFGVDGAGSSGNLFQMAFDMHNNCSDITVSTSTIQAAGQNAAIGVRNSGSGVGFYGNVITYFNSAGTPNSVFGIGDANLVDLKLYGNTIKAVASNTPLVAKYYGSFADSDSVVDMGGNTLTNIQYSSAFSCSGSDKISGYNAATGVYTCSADVNTGDVTGPATNTDSYVPQWNGADSKALKNGLAVGTGASNLVQLNGSSQLPAVSGALLTNLPNQLSQSTLSLTATSTSSTGPISVNPPVSDLATATAYSSFNMGHTNTTASPNAGADWRFMNLSPFYGGTGTLSQLTAFFVSPRNTSSGTVATLDSFTAWPRNAGSGSVNTVRSFYAKSPTNAGAGITTIYGTLTENQGLSGTANSYGVYIGNQSGSTNNYTLYTGTSTNGASFGDFLSLRNLSAPSATADNVRLYNVEGDYLHMLDEDGNDARIGQKTLSLGAASGGTATLESTSHATKGALSLPQNTDITGNLTVSGTINNPASAVDTDATVDTASTPVAIFTSATTTTLTASNVVAGRCFSAIITSTSGGAISFAGFTPTWMDGSAPGSITATKKTAITCMGTGANTADCIDKENY